jgi:TetR/AcrR family transcriptional repressor of nem operon
MRYPADHKKRVREDIVRVASRRFRRRGSESVAINELMRDLDLTHGGFYRHFSGKEELFREALIAGVSDVRARLTEAVQSAPPGKELEAVIDAYLSVEHCENPASGCPVAALLTEIPRHPRTTRSKFLRAIEEHAAALAPFLPGRTPVERKRAAVVLLSGMAGALNLARAAPDERLRRSILETARRFYLGAAGRRG